MTQPPGPGQHGGKVYRIPDQAPLGLGRHVNHDPISRRFAYLRRRDLTPPRQVYHERRVPIFDQGELGSCTGNAALGILGTEPYASALSESSRQYGPQTPTGRIPWSEEGAVSLYSAFTVNDPYEGTYPPDDTGSDGLTAAKVLTALGIVPGYEHTFSLDEALSALNDYPLLAGTVWTSAMFAPAPNGLIRTNGTVEGGHEWIGDEYVPAGKPNRNGVVISRATAAIGGVTSWGESFGVGGRFYMLVPDFAALLRNDGDVIVLTPPTQPAPIPAPEPGPATPPTTYDIAAAVRQAVNDALAKFGV